MLLSIGMMVKNEEKYLEQCLQSLVPVLEQIDSELIIVDTGSTDNTVKIAKRFTDKVYHHEWTNDFSEMRNIVLSYTSGEWFFYLDGDEVLEDPSGVIDFFISNKYKKFNCAGMSMNNLFQGDNLDNFGLSHALRFFKNDDEFHFKGIIHEQPQAKGPAAKIDGIITHYGYLNDDKELMEYKYQRNVELIEKVLEENPDDIYHLFQLSQSYAMYGDYKNALKPIERAYSIVESKDPKRYMYVFSHLSKIYFHNEKYQETIKIGQIGCKLKDGYLDLYYFQAFAQLNLGQFEKSAINFKKFLSLLEDFRQGKGIVDFSVSHTTASNAESAYLALCNIYTNLGNYQEALKYAEKISNPMVINDGISHLVEIYFKEERYDLLRLLLNKWVDDEGLSTRIFQAIENKLLDLDEQERKEVSMVFAEEETSYGLINTIRRDYYNKVNTNLDVVMQLLSGIDLNDKDVYYGELLFYLIRNEKPITHILKQAKNSTIDGFCKYLLHCYDGFKKSLINYLENSSFWSEEGVNQSEITRVRTALLYCLLQDDKLDDIECKKIFESYISSGTEYIQLSYHSDIIKNGKVSWTRSSADAFLLYMIQANTYDKASADYVKALRLALGQDETMKRGIELLLNDLKAQVMVPEYSELEKHKNTVLETIKEAINAGSLDIAIELISEYENIIGVDAQLCSAKSIVLMIEGCLEDAEQVLLRGLEIEPNNTDLLYNMGYLSELRAKPSKANKYYNLVTSISKDPSLLSDVNVAMSRLWSEVIPEFRKDKFGRKLSRLELAEEQILFQKEKPNKNIHIVYVMTHVNVCGGSKIIFEHTNRLVKLGHRVSIVCHFPKPNWYPVFANYIEVPFEEELAIGIPHCDVIVATYWDHIQECIETKIAPVVYFEQGDFHLFDDKIVQHEILKFIKRQYELPQFIMTVSRQAANLINEKYGRESRVFPNALDTKIFNKDGFKHPCGRPYILMMGSDQLAFKGIADVTEAFRDLDKKLTVEEKVDLYWITPTRPLNVPKEVSQVFINPSQMEIAELYRGALMFVSASHYETFSLPVLEAMSCGCPVITTDSMGIRDYVNQGINAIICGVQQTTEIAKAMYALLKDANLRDSLINNGLFTAKKYDWDEIISNLECFLLKVSEKTPEIIANTKTFDKVRIRKKPVVSLVYTSPSGSNTIALYKEIPRSLSNRFDISLIGQTNTNEFRQQITKSDVVVITEGNNHFNNKLLNPNQFVVDLWHGFPLKTIGYMNKNEPYIEILEGVWQTTDILVSYSRLFNDLMGRCLGVDESKCKILGAPRNDFLFKSDGKNNLSNLMRLCLKNKNIIFYMPTWRHSPRGNASEGDKKWNNIFGMQYFDTNKFDKFLFDNNCILIIKIHPAEEQYVLDKLQNMRNIKVLSNFMLAESGQDLYELLNGADILITDYSSVYFDFLLLNRPVIFTPTDIKAYQQDRGFLLEPYEDWTPGDKVFDQARLEKSMIEALNNPNAHSTARKRVSNSVHHFHDGLSSERVWSFIEEQVIVRGF